MEAAGSGVRGELITRDRLEITVPRPPFEIELRVNGRDLVELVLDAEAEAGRHHPEGLAGIRVDGLELARDRLLGVARDWPDDGQILLLDCPVCGIEGCDRVTATVDIGGDRVVWREFRAFDGPVSGLRFTFDREAYEAEVNRALPPGLERTQPRPMTPEERARYERAWEPGLVVMMPRRIDLRPVLGALTFAGMLVLLAILVFLPLIRG